MNSMHFARFVLRRVACLQTVRRLKQSAIELIDRFVSSLVKKGGLLSTLQLRYSPVFGEAFCVCYALIRGKLCS